MEESEDGTKGKDNGEYIQNRRLAGLIINGRVGGSKNIAILAQSD